MPSKHSSTLARVLPLLLLFAAFPPETLAKTYYVERWGADSAGCGSRNQPCQSIVHVMDLVRKNDRIVVGPGYYQGNITIDANANGDLSGLRLESVTGRFSTVIRYSATGGTIAIHQPNVRIGKPGKGFRIIPNPTSGYGVLVASSAASRGRVEGNYVLGGTYGLFLRGEKILVGGNLVDSAEFRGIYCTGCQRGIIRDNVVLNTQSNTNARAIYIAASDKIAITGNHLRGNDSIGIYFTSNNEDVKVSDNLVVGSGSDSIRLDNATGAFIKGNIVGDSSDEGIWIEQLSQGKAPRVQHNLAFSNGDPGIRIASGMDVNISNNTISDTWADNGINLGAGATIGQLANNNTIDSEVGCGIANNSGNPVIYRSHYFGPGEGVCGGNLAGSAANRPNRTNVGRAARQ